jgi:hypothetical protein
MTTIMLTDGTTYLEIFATKITEQSDKNLVNWAEVVNKSKWSTSNPKKYTMDTLNITRSFTINGYINGYSADSSGTTKNALHARDRLNSYLNKGGTVKFLYGSTGDLTGLKSAYNDSGREYYNTTGISVHVVKLQIDETPKGADSGEFISTPNPESYSTAEKQVPEEFQVSLNLLVATEYTD